MNTEKRVEAYQHFFGGDPSQATKKDAKALQKTGGVPTEEERNELDSEIVESIDRFLDSPDSFLAEIEDDSARVLLEGVLRSKDGPITPEIGHGEEENDPTEESEAPAAVKP